ncbi:hypothetical protein BKA56DRAFT_606771 [Ilyonectria sp. MPI-CAGE-AT-0026]|nr:hypothetical protein BKA56DRAFT_606771 [Ilyonectria sp. MPI-CAGE-AT-0026]
MADSQDAEPAVEPRADTVIKACDNCRHRKIRCNRQSPCSNCQRTGHRCTTSPRVPRSKRRPSPGPSNYDGRISSIEERLDRMSQVLETLVADGTKSRRSTASLEDANSPMSLPFSLSRTPVTNDLTAQQDLPFPGGGHSGRVFPAGHTPSSGSRQKEPKNNPNEGPSSFSAHSTLAIDFLHKVADAEGDSVDNTEIRELLDSLHQIVDAVKVRRQSTESLFPLADHSAAQRSPADLPPIQVAVAAIRKAQDLCDLSLTVINELLHDQSLSDICLTVYFSQDYSNAEFIIVNVALYFLISDSTLAGLEDGQQGQSCENYRLLCQRNIETALSKLSLYIGATHDMALALALGAMYEVDMSRPSLAWTLICAAYQCSYSLGYHTRAYGSNPSSDVPNQSGLLFWAIYYLEKHLCLRLGRCSAILDPDITVPPPGGNGTASSPGTSHCRVIVKAGSLTSRVYEELYSAQASFSPRELRMQRVLSLSQELCGIREESRKVFQTWIQSRSDEGLPGVDILEYLAKIDEVFWWSLLTLIYRAVPAHPDFSMNYANDCIASARAALASHQAFASTRQLSGLLPLSSYINWTIISSPFVPFLVLFCNAIEHEDVNDLDAMQGFVDSIESASHCSVPIAKHHRLFHVFHNVARRYLQMKAASTPSQQGHAELRKQMDHCLSALGLQPHDCMQNGFEDGSMVSPSIMPMQQIQGNDTEMGRGVKQPVQIMNCYLSEVTWSMLGDGGSTG